MSKIFIVGTSVTITSEFMLSDLKRLEKFAPEALALVDGETNETVFKVGTKSADINQYGISFTETDTIGRATLTKIIPGPAGERSKFVVENYGKALMYFETIENNIAEALEVLSTQQKTLEKSITVVDA